MGDRTKSPAESAIGATRPDATLRSPGFICLPCGPSDCPERSLQRSQSMAAGSSTIPAVCPISLTAPLCHSLDLGPLRSSRRWTRDFVGRAPCEPITDFRNLRSTLYRQHKHNFCTCMGLLVGGSD